ncbi:MAG TPA: type II toxin-antitoxin system VapB family antitoxin [Caulobacter sp.]|nr:type II toxin-antitoxin system VapB family antitoxin [Caulobacter sp.]
MALSIKTKEADQLARELSRLTGETMTEAVTIALRERLARRRAQADGDMIERVKAFTQSIAHRYDRRPVTKAEWDALSGEDD